MTAKNGKKEAAGKSPERAKRGAAGERSAKGRGKEEEEALVSPEMFRETGAVLLILSGLFALYSITNPPCSGKFGESMGTFLNSNFGWASLTVPLILLIAGCHTFKQFTRKVIIFYPIVTIVLIFSLEMMRNVLLPGMPFLGAPASATGLMASGLVGLIGAFGAVTILAFISVICLLLFTGKTFREITGLISDKAGRAGTAISEGVRRAGERRRENERRKAEQKAAATAGKAAHPASAEPNERDEEDKRRRFLSDEEVDGEETMMDAPSASASEASPLEVFSRNSRQHDHDDEEDYELMSRLDESGPEEEYPTEIPDPESGRITFEDEPAAGYEGDDSSELVFLPGGQIREDGPEDEAEGELDFLQTAAPEAESAPPRAYAPPSRLPVMVRADQGGEIARYPRPSISILAEKDPYRRASKPPVDQSEALIDKLESFGVEATVADIVRGPAITRYELKLGDSVKVSKFTSLQMDLAVFFANKIRIEAPVPGKSCVGIEVPNETIEPVYLREVIGSDEFKKKNRRIPIALGKDITGNTIVGDLARMPHLLVAGSTGSGKSVCMNCIIASILFKFSPAEVQMVMIDPKQVELSMYEGIPHLINVKATPDSRIITDPKIASAVLAQMTEVMDARYSELKKMKTKNIFEYNEKSDTPMPYIIILIDEFFDLMMVSNGAIEAPICRLTQLGRAAGIHLVIATQRPTVNCITGTIKVNVPSRIAFAVTNAIDSKTILDKAGAENLLGKGDMLYQPADAGEPKRVQGAFMSTQETERLVAFWQGQPQPENMLSIDAAAGKDDAEEPEEGDEEKDELYDEALEYIISSPKNASVSSLQRRFRIGYPRAGKIIDQMERRGAVGPADGSKPRKVLVGGVQPTDPTD